MLNPNSENVQRMLDVSKGQWAPPAMDPEKEFRKLGSVPKSAALTLIFAEAQVMSGENALVVWRLGVEALAKWIRSRKPKAVKAHIN